MAYNGLLANKPISEGLTFSICKPTLLNPLANTSKYISKTDKLTTHHSIVY